MRLFRGLGVLVAVWAVWIGASSPARADSALVLKESNTAISLPGDWTVKSSAVNTFTLDTTDEPKLELAVAVLDAHCEAVLLRSAAVTRAPDSYVARSALSPAGYEPEALERPNEMAVCAMIPTGALSVVVLGDYRARAPLVHDVLGKLLAALQYAGDARRRTVGPRRDGFPILALAIDLAPQPGFTQRFENVDGEWTSIVERGGAHPFAVALQYANELDCVHHLEIAAAKPGARLSFDAPYLPGAPWVPAVVLAGDRAITCVARADNHAIVATLSGDYAATDGALAKLLGEVMEAFGRQVTQLDIPVAEGVTVTLAGPKYVRWTAVQDSDENAPVIRRLSGLAVVVRARPARCYELVEQARAQAGGTLGKRPWFPDRLWRTVVEAPGGDVIACVEGAGHQLLLTIHGSAALDGASTGELVGVLTALADAVHAAPPDAFMTEIHRQIAEDDAKRRPEIYLGAGFVTLHAAPTDTTAGTTAENARFQIEWMRGESLAVSFGADGTFAHASQGNAYDARATLGLWRRWESVQLGVVATGGVDAVKLDMATDPFVLGARGYGGGVAIARVQGQGLVLEGSLEIDSTSEKRLETSLRYSSHSTSFVKGGGLGLRHTTYDQAGSGTELMLWLAL